MDAQIDYAAGMSLIFFDDVPVADPATPSPGMLCPSNDQVDESDGMHIAMLEELPASQVA